MCADWHGDDMSGGADRWAHHKHTNGYPEKYKRTVGTGPQGISIYRLIKAPALSPTYLFTVRQHAAFSFSIFSSWLASIRASK